MPLLVLHISDIHFRFPQCTTDMDPERPYRTALLADVDRMVNEFGPIGAILVTGDIAFQGLKAEFDSALIWLIELAKVARCGREDVYVVPGNHDVDRTVVSNNLAVRNAQRIIASAESNKRSRELAAQLGDAEAGPALFRPLSAYNDFAANFRCQVFPAKPRWIQDIRLTNEVTLRLHGLTSTVLSGMNGDDKKGALLMGDWQLAVDPVDHVVNAVLAHHPPDWFCDCDEVDDAVQERASIHLFGHKHRQRIVQEANYVRYSAGAVNPDQGEPKWQPGYNIVSLSVEAEGGRRFLRICSHIREWQSNPDRFRARVTSTDATVFDHRLQVRGTFVDDPPVTESPIVALTEPQATPMTAPETKNLILRFWALSSSQRRDVCFRLGVLERDDLLIPEPERYARALELIGERGLTDKLVAEVSNLEPGNR